MITHTFSFPVIIDDEISNEKEWIFPKHRFFEYEPKDEKSCKVLGIGYEQLKPKAYLTQIYQGTVLLCNRTFEAELRKKVENEQEKDSVSGHGRVYSRLEYSCGQDA